MKIQHPKTLFLSIFIAAISCQDEGIVPREKASREKVNNPTALLELDVYNMWEMSSSTQPLYDGSDGGPIDLTTATSWISNFNATTRPGTFPSTYFDRIAIDKILLQRGCTGLRIYHAINTNGERKMLITGVNNKGGNMNKQLILSTAGINYVGGTISTSIAKTWTTNYRMSVEPNAIRSHYFGHKIFNQILAQPGCIGFRAQYATTETGESKLIIIGVNAEGGDMLPDLFGRSEVTLGDFSFPCPSVCPPTGTDGDL